MNRLGWKRGLELVSIFIGGKRRKEMIHDAYEFQRK